MKKVLLFERMDTPGVYHFITLYDESEAPNSSDKPEDNRIGDIQFVNADIAKGTDSKKVDDMVLILNDKTLLRWNTNTLAFKPMF